MNRLLTKEEQQLLDREFCALTGLPPLILMEQAAAGLTGVIGSLLESCQEKEGAADVLIFAGGGNNGGDGWASARQLLAAGYEVLVFDAYDGQKADGDHMINRQAFEQLGGTIIDRMEALAGREPLIAVDALYGTGFNSQRQMPEKVREALHAMAQLKGSGSLIVACDIPSGVDANTGQAIPETVAADLTCTFGRKKIGLVTHPGLLYAGEVFEFPLSMTDEFVEQLLEGRRRVFELDENTAGGPVPERRPDAHKGQFGRLLLIGGQEGMAGALILAARASERMGVGYTMIRAPEKSLPLIAGAVPSALLSSVPEEGSVTKHELPQPDAIAVGPGAGSATWVEKAVRHLIGQPMPIIIDADGLNALARMEDAKDLLQKRREKGFPPAVLTPHPGEFLRLAPGSEELLRQDRLAAARQLADETGAIVVLKGMATVIAMPDGDAWINTTGNAGLAKGGSGDVLTGMIAGLAAQGGEVGDAVKRAVYLHGLAADIALERHLSEIAVTPEDLIDSLGEAVLC